MLAVVSVVGRRCVGGPRGRISILPPENTPVSCTVSTGGLHRHCPGRRYNTTLYAAAAAAAAAAISFPAASGCCRRCVVGSCFAAGMPLSLLRVALLQRVSLRTRYTLRERRGRGARGVVVDAVVKLPAAGVAGGVGVAAVASCDGSLGELEIWRRKRKKEEKREKISVSKMQMEHVRRGNHARAH